MTPCAILGVDPGVKGGMALLRPDGSVAYTWVFRPGDEEGEVVAVVVQAAALLKQYGGVCFFEKVQHMTGDGAQGSHTFGFIKGLLRGALLAHGVRPHYVPPQLWQAKLECLTGGDKNVSKRRAIEIFPGVTVTHGNADALLIAMYGRLMVAS